MRRDGALATERAKCRRYVSRWPNGYGAYPAGVVHEAPQADEPRGREGMETR
jgi:hypothetical protein